MASKRLEVIITGKATGALKAIHDTEGAAGGLKGKVASAGKAMVAFAATGAAAAVAFGVKSAKTFENVGKEVGKLSRLTGMSSVEASKLRFVMQQSGIGAEQGARGIAAFSKKLVASKDSAKDFGFQTRDASGHLLPMSELLARAADRMKGMADGAEKNAYAQKLFGKGGLEMVKMLNKGRGGMSDLAKEAEKYGLVLTDKNMDAVKKATEAHRQQEAAMQGLQVQIGTHVLPILTKFTTFVATQIPKATKWFNDHQSVVKKLAFVVGGVLVVGFLAWAASAASAAAATLAATWPILAVLAALGLLVAGLIYAYKHWGWFKTAVDATVKFLKGTAWPAIKTFIGYVRDGFAVLVRWIRDHWGQIRTVISVALNAIKGTISAVLLLITGDWKGAWEIVKRTASDAWARIGDGVRAGIDKVGAYLKELPGKIPGWIGNLNDLLYEKGTDLIKGLNAGIRDHLPSLSDLVHRVTQMLNPVNGLGSLFGREAGAKTSTAGRSASYKPSVSRGGGYGQTVIHVHVAGSVVTVKQLAEDLRNAAIAKQRQTGQPWIPAV